MDVLKKNKIGRILYISFFIFYSTMASASTEHQIPNCIWDKSRVKCSIPLRDIASSMEEFKNNTNGNLTLSMYLSISDLVEKVPVAPRPKVKIPENGSIWAKSYSLEQQKHYVTAADILGPLLNISPHNELVLLRLGWLNYLQEKYEVSEGYYHKAINLNNLSIDAKLGITLPLMAQQRWKEAAVYANQVIAVSAWHYFGHIRLMTCESGLTHWEILEKHAAEFIQRYPSDVDGFIFLARSQAMLGKTQLAIHSYEEVLARSPANIEALDYLAKKKQ